MDLSQIFAVLQNADKQAQTTNPYSGFANIGNQLGQSVIQAAPNNDIGEVLGAGLITGLLGGGAQYFANDYQADQNAMAQDALFNIWGGGQQEKPEGMSPNVWSSIDNAGKLFGAQRKLDIMDDTRKSDLQLRNTFMQSLATAKTPYEREQAVATGKALGILPQGFQMGETQPQPMAQPTETRPEIFPGGPKSINSEFDAIFKGFQQQGATPNAAVDAATTLTAAKRKALTGSVDKVAEARAAADKLEAIAQTARAGMEGAGNTGGFAWPIKNLASSAYALINSEEGQQRASQKLLDSVRPELFSAVRTKGIGAMSDAEMREYLGAGPASSNTPQENALLAQKIEQTAQLQRSYADFLDAYREEKGTVQGAEQLWSQYKQANPMFVRDPETKAMVFNTERPSWQDFFLGGAAQPTTRQPAIGQSNIQQGGVAQPPQPPPGYSVVGQNPQTGKWILRPNGG